MKTTSFKQAFLRKYPKYKRVLMYMNDSLDHEFDLALPLYFVYNIFQFFYTIRMVKLPAAPDKGG